MKRSGKFYRKNEQQIMKSLGFKPTYNSGSGWIQKEDGESDYLMCQLKSTDAQSIKINQKDIRILEQHATTSHKIPVFAIQFLNTNEVWLLAKPEDFCSVSEYIETGKTEKIDFGIELNIEDKKQKCKRTIKSSGDAREQFHMERNMKYDKTKYAK